MRWSRNSRGRAGRAVRRKPSKVLPKGLKYATVHKERENGRVVKVTTRVVFGTLAAVLAALALSLVSKVVNTVFIERHNGSDRNRNRREGAQDVLLLEGLGGA